VRSDILRYCPICDGYELIGKRIAVLGHSASAIGEAIFMRTYTQEISVLTLGQPLEAEVRKRAADASLPVIEAAVLEVDEDGHRAIAVLADGRKLHFDALYGALGCTVRSELGRELGAACGTDQRFVTDDHQETSVPRLYAAGDVVRGLNQISVAMGEAAIAAAAIHSRLPANHI
jgi:thioredoxin reductase (NADPH)